MAPALAAGNAVVLKPDPRTPVCGGILLALIFEAAGLPAGVLHVLPGDADAGEALVTDPDVAMISFTGSTAVGRRVGELAGKHLKKVALELGGKNSLIILDDADLDLAVSQRRLGVLAAPGPDLHERGPTPGARARSPTNTSSAWRKRRKRPAGRRPVHPARWRWGR